VLEALLDKYADQGVTFIEDTKILQLAPFSDLGTPVELVNSFGGKRQYRAALQELEKMLYKNQADVAAS
jgi:type I restriction enzyme R subunit